VGLIERQQVHAVAVRIDLRMTTAGRCHVPTQRALHGISTGRQPQVLHAAFDRLAVAIERFVPDVKLHWGDVLVGAAVTALFFTLGKHAIGAYLGKATYGSTYGAAGSFVIILLWIYYSAQLFFFGAEFTRVYAVRLHLRKELQ